MKVTTRFAPSPTGYLHIGSARTAIFNYLFAKHYGGKFLLRIEDTDKARSTREATNAIIEGLDWLGVKHDGTIVLQSNNFSRHQQVAYELLQAGKAYKCFTSQEEIDKQRAISIEKGESFLFKSKWRDQHEANHPNLPYVIRIKAPTSSTTKINDLVQGEIEVQNSVLDDFVLLRSDGTPTYMLAVVVDDHDMEVTHIIRGDDHLNNAFRQKIIYEAAGWCVPEMAHIPLIHGEDGAKLSKRHGAVGVEWYKDAGYLPEALFNYLLRLGWSHGDDEIILKENAVKWFDGSHLGKSASRMNFDKLKFINSHYIKNATNEFLISEIKNSWSKQNIVLDATTESFILKAIDELKVRSELLSDIANLARIFHSTNDYEISEDARNVISSAPKGLTKKVIELVLSLEDLDKDNVQNAFKMLASTESMKLGELMNPIRAMITGKIASPSVFVIISILGKEIIVERLSRYL